MYATKYRVAPIPPQLVCRAHPNNETRTSCVHCTLNHTLTHSRLPAPLTETYMSEKASIIFDA
eukprot:17478-Eustigmatos_ZCMA.PRE.1